MRSIARWSAGLLLVVASVGIARPAHAGVLSKSIDLVYIQPFLGAEMVRLGSADLLSLQASDFTASGLTVGGTAGIRLGPISLGMLLQHTTADTPNNETFSMNKLYGELGINAAYGRVVIPVHFDFGYAYINTPDVSARGPGGKVGIGIDIYAWRVWSIGAGADLDVQAYNKDNKLIGGYGGTFVGRIGLHL